MAGSARKDGVSGDDLAVQAQAYAAGGVARHMVDRQTPLADGNVGGVEQFQVALQAKGFRIGWVQADDSFGGAANGIKAANVVGMAVGEQDATYRGITHGGQDRLSVSTGIYHGQLPGHRAMHQVAVHGPRTHFQTSQF